jgi:hypothetical protein
MSQEKSKTDSEVVDKKVVVMSHMNATAHLMRNMRNSLKSGV